MKRRTTSIQSSRGRLRRVIVVGAGAAGLMATFRLAEANVPVLLVSRKPARRSQPAGGQAGINAVLGRDETDDERAHFEDSIAAGELLAQQPPVRGLVEAAPRLVEVLTAMGVPFARTDEGQIATRQLVGSRWPRTAFVSSTTGGQIVAALDQQVRRLETVEASDDRGSAIPGEKMVERLESHTLSALVLDDDGAVSGIVATDLRTLRVQAFPGDAVCLATGGYDGLFGCAGRDLSALGAATAIAFRAGAVLANPELVQLHPAAIAGTARSSSMGEAVLAAGGRLWVAKSAGETRPAVEIPERERDYVLEGSKAQRDGRFLDAAVRAIMRAHGARDTGKRPRDAIAYLDVTHLPASALAEAIGPTLDLYETLTGESPHANPMRVRPGVDGSLGGLWVDYEPRQDGGVTTDSPRSHATSLPGLYACGEAAAQYHGARRLAGNAMLGELYGGLAAASGVLAYRDSVSRSAFDLPGSIFDRQENAIRESHEERLARAGEATGDNPFVIKDDLGKLFDECLFAERDDAALDDAVEKLGAIEQQLAEAGLSDTSTQMNQSFDLLRQLEAALPLARAVAMSARHRDECRGNHDKPALASRRNDDQWLKSTLVRWQGGEIVLIDGFEYSSAGNAVAVTDAIDTSAYDPRREEND